MAEWSPHWHWVSLPESRSPACLFLPQIQAGKVQNTHLVLTCTSDALQRCCSLVPLSSSLSPGLGVSPLALAVQKGRNYLKPAIKKRMCTKQYLKHPCLVHYFPGKDAECVLVFKFNPAPEKTFNKNFLELGETWLSPCPGGSCAQGLSPGGNAVPWAQAMLSSHPAQYVAHSLTTYIWQFSLGKCEELCWCFLLILIQQVSCFHMNDLKVYIHIYPYIKNIRVII